MTEPEPSKSSEADKAGSPPVSSDTLLLFSEHQDSTRRAYSEHLARVAVNLQKIAEAITDPNVETAQQKAILGRLEAIANNLGRMSELRQQADIHHTELLALILNGQNGLRTEIAEIKHWVMRLALRGTIERSDGTTHAATPDNQIRPRADKSTV